MMRNKKLKKPRLMETEYFYCLEIITEGRSTLRTSGTFINSRPRKSKLDVTSVNEFLKGQAKKVCVSEGMGYKSHISLALNSL